MVTYKMHFTRTGKTGPGDKKRFVGGLDLPICMEGERELAAMRESFEYPDAETVFSSPLSRCVRTSEILYPKTRIEIIDGFRDMDLGEFAGKSFDELRGRADFSAWVANSVENPIPGGEDIRVFTKRIVKAASSVFFKMMDQRLLNVAVITHIGVIMTLLAAIGLPKANIQEWACKNGEGYTLLFTPGMWMQSGAAEVYCRIPGKGKN